MTASLDYKIFVEMENIPFLSTFSGKCRLARSAEHINCQSNFIKMRKLICLMSKVVHCNLFGMWVHSPLSINMDSIIMKAEATVAGLSAIFTQNEKLSYSSIQFFFQNRWADNQTEIHIWCQVFLSVFCVDSCFAVLWLHWKNCGVN